MLVAIWIAFGALALGAGNALAAEPPNLEGVWGMVQHDRLGAPFFIPIEPTRTPEGKELTDAFVAKYDVESLEANGSCVEPGMPTVMWGIGGAAMEVVQQPNRITLMSELANQSRRIYLDGRNLPDGFPDQRVGFSVGRWEGDVLVIDTMKITEWHAPRWPHSDQMRIVKRWYLKDASAFKITGLRPDRPPKAEGTLLVNEMYPVMKQAKENGTVAGLEVTTSVQGGEPGIITLNMFYAAFAARRPAPVAKTLGPQGTAAFLTKCAGLISQLEQRILKRVPELSF
jgi:hypothetical protein